MDIKIDSLEKLTRDGSIRGSKKKKIEILLAAINDWPTVISTLNDYLTEVTLVTGPPVTRKTIESGMKKLSFSSDAWKIESLTQLSELLDINESLEQFFTELESLIASDNEI